MHVEQNNLEAEIRERTIKLWHEINEKFKQERTEKKRF